eukprot:COSAG04_NODE_9811_length_830_cov_1.653899_2_plen_72_part_01
MPTPTLGYEDVARTRPKKRLPAADGGQCLPIYFFPRAAALADCAQLPIPLLCTCGAGMYERATEHADPPAPA